MNFLMQCYVDIFKYNIAGGLLVLLADSYHVICNEFTPCIVSEKKESKQRFNRFLFTIIHVTDFTIMSCKHCFIY